MPSITIIEASELFGKSKRTIQRYLSNGKLSFTEQGDNTKMLCVDELQAVFGELSPLVIAGLSPIVTPITTDLATSNPLLERLIELQEKQLAATLENTALLKQLLEGKTVMAIEELAPYEPKITTVAPVSNYLDDIPVFCGAR